MKSEFIIHLIARVHDQANKFLTRELKKHNIDAIAPSHGDVIGALCINEQMSMKALAQLINKDKSTVTALVNKLMQLGYVEKKNNPQDNRVTLVSLTEKGKTIKPQILNISQKMREKAYCNLSQEEQQMLVSLLMKVHRSF